MARLRSHARDVSYWYQKQNPSELGQLKEDEDVA